MNNNRILIIVSVLLFFSAASFLMAREQHLRQPSGWWAIAFSDPHDVTRGFFIENTTQNPLFRYTITIGSAIVAEKEISVPPSTKTDISLSIIETENKSDAPLTITVMHDDEKRTIYQNLSPL